MIRKANLAQLQLDIRAFDMEQRVVCSDETTLLAYGIVDSTPFAEFDVSATLFEKITRAVGNTVRTEKGKRKMTYSHDTVISEGTNLGSTIVDEIVVYPIVSVQARLKIRGDKRDLSLPVTEARVVDVPQQRPEKTWSNLDAVQQAFELRLAKADWYYSYSDDNRVWKAGKAECETLEKEAKTLGGIFNEMYEYYSNL